MSRNTLLGVASKELRAQSLVFGLRPRIEFSAAAQLPTVARSAGRRSAEARQKAVVSLARASCVARGAVVLGSPLRLKKSHGSLYPEAPGGQLTYKHLT